MGTYSIDPNVNKEKAVKELELICKKIKKRMTVLDSSPDLLTNSPSYAILSQEYRQIKETIIRIIQM